tara:strand:- start:850 stop:1254 length:405 start_codon:yes stop_codon:yes gene_type:complete
MENKFQKSHGGRDEYVEIKKRSDYIGDCAIRATAIFLDLPYHEVRDDLFEIAKKRFNMPNADAVVYEYLQQKGFEWKKTIYKYGKTKFRLGEFPINNGRVMCRLRRHWATIVDGVVLDTWDCRYRHVGRYIIND